MRSGVPTDQALLDRCTVINVANDPTPMKTLRHIGCDATTGKWITHQVARIRRELYDPIQNDGGQFICWPVLVLPMPHRGNIIPNIGQVDAFGIQIFLVASVVLDILSAVAAFLNRRSDKVSVKNARLRAFDIEKHPVMARRKTVGDWQAVRLVNGDPVLESQFRKGVEVRTVFN